MSVGQARAAVAVWVAVWAVPLVCGGDMLALWRGRGTAVGGKCVCGDGERLQQLVPQMPPAPVFGGERAGVRLIHDDQFRARAYELIPSPAGFDILRRDDNKRVQIEERLRHRRATFQPGGGGGQHKFGLNVKLVPQLALPLLGQRRRAKHRQALNFTAGKQLTRHQSGLNGLANTDIIRDQEPDGLDTQRHEQRDKLVRTRPDRYTTKGTKRGGTIPQ